MSRFVPSAKLRRHIAERANYSCSYCKTQEKCVGTLFTIDHIIPQSLNGSNDIDNLCLSCWESNVIKNDRLVGIDPETGKETRLFNPNTQKWVEHFAWESNGAIIIGLTSTGRATVAALKLNRSHLVAARQLWINAGLHPPRNGNFTDQ